MKAIVYERFGGVGVLQLREMPEPTRAPGHVRVAVHAAAVNPKDVLLRRGKLRWLVRTPLPRIPGYDIAGTVLEDTEDFAAGTEVYGMIQDHRAGACAEVVSLPASELAVKPAALSMQQAASLPLAGLTALQALRDELRLQPGQTVLINGASGGVGTLAVQIGKALGARVIGVCSGRNTDFVTELGADEVIDYTQAHPKEARGLDALFDAYGTLPWPVAKSCLRPKGRYCTAIPKPGALVRGALTRARLHRAALVVVRSRRTDLEELRRLVEAGSLRPIVESTYPLEKTALGHRRVESRRTRGKVVIEISHPR